MRRNLLHISLALLTFTIGFLSSGTSEGLTAALIVALVVFVLLKKITSLNLNAHHLKVALLTLLIWIPFAALIFNSMSLGGSCVIDIPIEESRYGIDQNPPIQKFIQPSITFQYIGVMSVRTLDRGCIEMREYESNDGVKIYTSTDEYESPAQANKELQRMLRGDVKVIERNPLQDGYGKQIGERVVAIRFYDGDDRVYSFIARQEGINLHYIGSPLLSRALEFEDSP